MTPKKQNSIVVIKCKKCNHFIWSRNRHDFRWCKCHSVAIDGGRDYTKVTGEPKDYETHIIKIPKGVVKTSFVDFGKQCMNINKANGWDVPTWESKTDIPVKSALLHSEISEALEDFRHNDFENFVEELADVFVRAYDLGAAINPTDFEAAFSRLAMDLYIKIQINLKRGYRHGGKRV